MKKIRYAVVGLGHISQNALLPAFKNVKNSELALLSPATKQNEKKSPVSTASARNLLTRTSSTTIA